LFTCDADSETDIGTGWYRPTRIHHIVSAGEYGWRYDAGPWLPYGKWPDYYVDSVGSVVDIGVGSPAGMVFGTRARFPAPYQRALYSADWAWGKIYAIHLQPHGASYTATFETFIEGMSLPITDVVIHTDGDMYFTVGGRKAASGLFRVRYVGDDPVEPIEPLADPISTDARHLRRQLERFHGREHPDAVAEAWPHLGDVDRAIRYAARVAIEHQALPSWQQLAFQEQRSWAVIQAAVALARTGSPELQADVLRKLNQLPLEQFSEEKLLAAIRAYGLVLIRLGGKNPDTVADVRAILEPLFPSSSMRLNRELCRLLVYLEAPRVVEQALMLLRSSQTQPDQLFYLSTLVQRHSGWTLDQRREFFRWLNVAQTTHLSGADALGRRELDERLANLLSGFRDDAVQQLSDEERTSLKSVIEDRQLEGLVGLESTRRTLHNWQMADLLPLLDQVDRDRSYESGRLAYEAAQCAKCHRFGDQGSTSGPDITAVGKRFQPVYMLEALLLPSQVIPDPYRTEIIHTEDGSIYTGRVVHEDGRRLQIRTDPFARQLIEISADEIESRNLSNASEMPAGIVNILTKKEILDLIAYLRAGGDPNDKAFTK
jgi:putative heme-binding domain-containing protein